MDKKQLLLKIFRIAALVLVIAAVAVAVASYMFMANLEKKMKLPPKEVKAVGKVIKKPTDNAPFYVLLVGTDRRPDWSVSRADTIMVLRVDTESKRMHLLSIPRDSRVAIEGHGLDKINHSFAFGGAPLLIKTVEDFTGLPINYYFQVDFQGFSEMVDAVGGIYFNVDSSWINGKNQTVSSGSNVWVDKLSGSKVRFGNLKRDGKEILGLLRVRSYPDGDFTRIKHQQQFIREVMKQTLNSYTDIPRLASIGASYTRTNMDIAKIIALGKNFTDPQLDLQMATVPGKTGMLKGVSYVFPDNSAKDELVRQMKEGQNFSQGPK
ncbi:MAG: LCP family protein [Firmicutes bacterium]|nr:LCP family protein [Bacillota bacterium]